MDNERIVITVDTEGTDNGSEYIVKGVSDALKQFNDVDIILTGQEKELKAHINKYGIDENRVEIINAGQAITCHDAPVEAIRTKKDSSLALALGTVKEGKAKAVISGGNTGAILAGGQLLVGRTKGVKRTPLAPLVPTEKGQTLLIDCGANVDSKPDYLVQFAKMGSIYMENIEKVKNPKVAIVNIGAEDEKGNDLVKTTIPLLRECKDINFVGSIEARDIAKGEADVVVCDAFVGNVILKFFEGVGSMFLHEIKGAFYTNLKSKIGALLVKKPLEKRLSRFKATDKGGAPLLGLKGLVVKVHGNCKDSEVSSAIAQCRNFVITGVMEQITEAFANSAKAE